MANDADVVVVGGRIAACLTAIRLAARGVSVRLLESVGLPSDAVSTHFVRGDGLVRSLYDVGVLDEVLATGAPTLVCEYFSVDGSPFEQSPPREPGRIGFCLSVRWSTLDVILARRAASMGVDLRTRTRVVNVATVDRACVGVIDHQGTVHRAEVVVGADGRHSTIARLVDAPDEERHPAARATYYRYATGWRSPPAVGPEFALDEDHFSHMFPGDAGIACPAVSVPLAAHDRSRGEAVDRLVESFSGNPHRRPHRRRRLDRRGVCRAAGRQRVEGAGRPGLGPGG